MRIALCGYARVGKDAICRAFGFRRVGFADALKSDLEPLFKGFGGLAAVVSDASKKEAIRPLLVEYGRAMRRLRPDYWIERLETQLPAGDWCIADCRYLNEANFVLSRGGVVVRVHRQGIGPANDEEQRTIDEIDAALPGLPQLDNSGTIEQAAGKLRDIVFKRKP